MEVHLSERSAQRSIDMEPGLPTSSTGRNSGPEGLCFRKSWKGLRPADRNFGPETMGVSTRSQAKMHLPRHTDPLVGSWWKFAKALPPAGRNFQEEVASPVWNQGYTCTKILQGRKLHRVHNGGRSQFGVMPKMLHFDNLTLPMDP
jgi:hypothetical protein